MMFFLSLGSSYPVGTTLSITSNFAYVYKDSSFSSEKFEFNLEKGFKVDLIDENLYNDFYNVSFDYEDKYYEGYIYKENLSLIEENQNVVLSYNARIVGNKTKIYAQDKTELKANDGQNILLNENHEVYLYEGYDHKKEFTAIKFSYNNEIYIGLVATKDIAPYGVSTALIVSITAIISCVGIILILLGVNKKKAKIIPVSKKNED